MLRRGFLFALAHEWRELREIGNGYVNVGHGTRVILSVSSLGLSGGQELTITTDVFSFPCYQFPFVFTHINKWIQKHTTPFSPHPHIISATWTWVHKTIKSALQSLPTWSIPIKHIYVTIIGWGHWGDCDHGQWTWPVTRESLPWDNRDINNTGSKSTSSGEYHANLVLCREQSIDSMKL